jgi:hypothetical protein
MQADLNIHIKLKKKELAMKLQQSEREVSYEIEREKICFLLICRRKHHETRQK